MTGPSDPRLIERLNLYASLAALLSIGIGLSSLIGRTLHITTLSTWGAAQPIAPNSAACMVLAGVSLWFLRKSDKQSFATGLVAKTAAGIVGLVGLFTLAEHLFGVDFGMSPVSAVAFVLLGLALLGIDWRMHRGDWPSQFLCFGAMICAAFGCLGLFLEPSVSPTTLALPTVVSFFILTTGLLCSRPAWAMGGLLASRSQGAKLLRGAIPAALLLLGGVGFSISKALLADAHFTWVQVSVFAVLSGAMLAGFVTWIAFVVEQSETQRRRVEQALDVSKEELDRLLDRVEEPQSEAKLRRNARWAFTVAVFLTSLLGFLSWHTAQKAAEDADWVAHTHEVSTTLEATLRHSVDVETGGRGFAETGSPLFLAPYESGRQEIGLDLHKLHRLVVDPEQAQRLNVLEGQSKAQVEEGGRIVAARQNAGKVPTLAQFELGKRIMDAVRMTVEQMEARQTRLLEQRTGRARVAQQFTSSLIALGSLLGVVFLTLAGLSVVREIGISARAQAQVKALNTDLERRVVERTAALEVEVAQRVETEAKLRASEEMFRMLLDGIKDYAVYMLDRDGRVASWNAGAARIKGYQADEIIGKHVDCFYVEADRDRKRPEETLREAATTGRFEEQGWRVRKDGSKFWADAVITPLYEANGVLRGYCKVVRDITDRKRADDELRKQAALLDLALDAIIVRDLENRVVFWNRGARDAYGWSKEEAIGRVTHDLLQTKFPISRPDIEDLLERKGDWEGELRHVTRQGAEVVVASRWSLQRDEHGVPTAILEINRDITDRKLAEAALGESEGRLAGIIASAMDAIITVDTEQRIILFNCAAEKMFRCPGNEAMGQPITRFMPQRFHAGHAGHIRKFGENGVTSRAMGPKDVLWALRADGQEFQIEASISQVVTRGKKLFTVIVRDVTERVAAEQAVREAQARMAGIVASAMDAIITVDSQQRILVFNAAAVRIFGYSEAEVLGQPLERLIPERFRSAHAAHIRLFGETGTTNRAMGQLGALWAIRSDGEEFQIEASISQVDVGGQKMFTVILRDVTERKQAEEIRERLAAVVDSSDDAIITKTLDGTITAWNRGAEKVFGYAASEAVGKPMPMLIPPERDHEESDIRERIRRGESVKHFETVRIRKDGARIDISATISPIRDSSGAIVGASKIARDITEGKRAEAALQESETNFRALVNLVPQIVWMCTNDGLNTYFNDRWVQYTGLTLEQSYGAGWNSPFHPDDKQAAWEAWSHATATGEIYRIESRLRAADDTYRWFLMLGAPLRDATGGVVKWFGTCTDIDEMKLTQAALRESEERFQAMANGIPQLAWMAHADGSIFWYNQRWYDYTGTTLDQMQGWAWESVHRRDLLPTVLEGWKAAIAASQPFDMEFPLRGADGSFRQFLTRVMPLKDSEGRVVRWFGTNTDITELKQARERLAAQAESLARQAQELGNSRESLEKQTLLFQLVLDSMGEGLIAADPEGHFVLWNDSASKLMGRNPADLPTEEWTQHYQVYLPDGSTPYPPDRLPLVRALRGESVQTELIIQHPGGADGVFLEVAARSMRDSDGRLCGGVAVLRDVTERKRAEAVLATQAEALLRSQAALESQKLMLQSVLDSMSEGLVTTDEQGKFIIWNPAAERIVGLGPANLSSEEWSNHYGLFLSDTVTPFPPEKNPLRLALQGQVSTADMFLRNSELGTGIWIESSASPLKDKAGVLRGGVIAFRDITQRKTDELEIRKLNDELEGRVLKRTAQLEAANHELEAFTYTVSHDLRAPLRHIGGFAGMCLDEFGTTLEPRVQHYLRRIQDRARGMGELVDGLLNLARMGRRSLQPQRNALNSIVEEVVSMLQTEAGERDVEWRIGSLPAVECDSLLIKQVFQNLISNAIKYSRPRAHAVIEIGQIRENGEPVIFVRDNGVGFSMKHADKLFGVFQRLHRAEDFEGTGVGLATVRRIIEKHGGRVWAESEADRGATFYFTVGASHAVVNEALEPG